MTQIVQRRPTELDSAGMSAPTPISIATILDKAVSGGMAPEALEKIVALYERVSDRAAAQEFAEAMARFQSKCPPIQKTSVANVTSNRTGSSHSYRYAELDEIARTVRPLLAAEGLSYSWDSTEDAGKLTCVCTIRHVNGHSTTAQFTCPTDTPAAMSAQQKNAAALTYARRQSLVQALGLTTCDPDTDGAQAPQRYDTITEHQAANLDAMLTELGPKIREQFMAWQQVKSLMDIHAARFAACVAKLEEKRAARNGGAA